MTPFKFHDAMRPRLEARVCAFIHTQLSFSQQQALMAHYRKLMTTAFCLEKCASALLPRLACLKPQQPHFSELVADVVSVFFMTTECFHAIDRTGSLTLRVNAYEARLARYLAKLAATLLDYQVATKNKPCRRPLKNGKIRTTSPRYVTEVAVGGLALKI